MPGDRNCPQDYEVRRHGTALSLDVESRILTPGVDFDVLPPWAPRNASSLHTCLTKQRTKEMRVFFLDALGPSLVQRTIVSRSGHRAEIEKIGHNWFRCGGTRAYGSYRLWGPLQCDALHTGTEQLQP